jgi:hypothetical protein
LFVGLTLIATYPIVRGLASYSYFDHSDAQLNMWIMAWDAHALAHHPTDLFNANIFYPERGTLAYSETLLGYLPIFGPILWMHGSPALAFNVVLLFSFAASGFGMYLLTRHLTGREWPGVVGGIAYAFVPYRFAHVPQIQLEAMEWMPLALLSLHLFVERGRLRYAAALGASVLLGTLCCIYYGVFMIPMLAIAMCGLMIVDRRARDVRTLGILGLTGCGTIALLAPLLSEYETVHRRMRFARSMDEVRERAGNLSSYAASAAPLHRALGMLSRMTPHDYLFPGFAVLVLGLSGVIMAKRRDIVSLYITIAVFGWIVSLGPQGVLGFSLYGALSAALPFFQGLRQISRIGVLTLFGLSVLAAFGCAEVERRLTRRRNLWRCAIALLVFMEVCQAPLRFDRPGGVPLTRVPDTPVVYRWLADRAGKFSILELPLPHAGQFWRNAPYVYWSTVDWHLLVNGYSGFASRNYYTLYRTLTDFPDSRSEDALAARDVRYVIVHWAAYTADDHPINVARLHRTPWLRRVIQFDHVDVFEVVAGPNRGRGR